jgi:hypothetical protein
MPTNSLFFSRFPAQELSNSSVYTAAISTPVNLGHNDPDEPKPDDDRQSKEQIR